jgi:hypothetical protein
MSNARKLEVVIFDTKMTPVQDIGCDDWEHLGDSNFHFYSPGESNIVLRLPAGWSFTVEAAS